MGVLSFTMDAWTSPNHKAYVAVTVHFENKGALVSMLLDIIELVHLHSGVNLAAAFTKILEEFGISDKVRRLSLKKTESTHQICARFYQSPVIMRQTMTQWLRSSTS